MSGSLVYCAINKSSATELTPEALATMCSDSQAAYDEDFAPMHGVLPVSVYPAQTAPTDARVVSIVDEDASAPDAVAYHTVDSEGRPTLVVSVAAARSEGGSLLDQISIALTHEIFETARNPFVAFCAMAPGKAVPQMLEVCDPVQGGSYRKNATAISNFVTPAYFDANDKEGPYDKCGQLTAPFTCDPNGYVAWADGSQTFGEKLSDAKKLHASHYSRAAGGVDNFNMIVPSTLDSAIAKLEEKHAEAFGELEKKHDEAIAELHEQFNADWHARERRFELRLSQKEKSPVSEDVAAFRDQILFGSDEVDGVSLRTISSSRSQFSALFSAQSPRGHSEESKMPESEESPKTIPAAPNPIQAVADGIVLRVRDGLREELAELEERITTKQVERDKQWWAALTTVQGDVKELRTDVNALKTTRIEIVRGSTLTRGDRFAIWMIALALTAAAILSAMRTQQLAREPLLHGVTSDASRR